MTKRLLRARRARRFRNRWRILLRHQLSGVGRYAHLVLYDDRVADPYVLAVPRKLLADRLDPTSAFGGKKRQLWLAAQPDDQTIISVDVTELASRQAERWTPKSVHIDMVKRRRRHRWTRRLRVRWRAAKRRRAHAGQRLASFGAYAHLVFYDWRDRVGKPYMLTVPKTVLASNLDRRCAFDMKYKSLFFTRRRQIWLAEQIDEETAKSIDVADFARQMHHRRTPQFIHQHMLFKHDRRLAERAAGDAR